jgi:excinuclease ABC subunit A
MTVCPLAANFSNSELHPMSQKYIVVRGAREHNLKHVSLDIPRNRFVVITGLSGSGKSSLAFDTIYAEGQRRYLESLSAYARQFMEQLKKPAVDSIEGLSPSISIEQKNISRNPRSTVGTVTEIYDYLRLLYARAGTPYDELTGQAIKPLTTTQIVDEILAQPDGTKIAILAPVARGKKGEFQKELLGFRSQGFTRARIDGEETSLADPIKLQKSYKHDISVYVDRVVLKSASRTRLADAVELATRTANGLVEVDYYGAAPAKTFSTKIAGMTELEPRTFSFNSPHGACTLCNGLGVLPRFDPDKIIPDPAVSIARGAIAPWSDRSEAWLRRAFQPLADHFGFDLNTAFSKIPVEAQQVILMGSGDQEFTFTGLGKTGKHAFQQSFEGVIPNLETRRKERSRYDDQEMEVFMSYQDCVLCGGARLKPEALRVLVGGKSIAQVCLMPIDECRAFFDSIQLSNHEAMIAKPILKEIRARLLFLENVGLSYLNLHRSSTTLSGGEAQRIRLATQIGSHLVGVLYVLDEPSIGLHQRDNEKLIKTLEQLRDKGNSVIVVEHDQETIERADYIVDLGPGAGSKGGHLVYSGVPNKILECKGSLTGAYLSGEKVIPVPAKRREAHPAKKIEILGAKLHNLRNVDVTIPLGCFVCVTGVSGSGKSSLIIDTLLLGLQNKFRERLLPSDYARGMTGLELLDKAIFVDQSPIGRTPRSNPATYTGVFTDIRALFANLPEAKARGYTASRFSFNVPGGRCEACSGDGTIRVTMHFLPDVFVECEVCHGRRYNRETLEIFYRGKTIADVLSMTIEEASSFFERVPQCRDKLATLLDVGLGYVQVGQSAVTLSGGEAQRIKLSKELNRRATGRTIYILDEPTTGLHFEDVKNLLYILQRLVDQGNTVLVIEHNLDVIKQADYLLDLGPEGGSGGGELIFAGLPENIVKEPRSYTGQFLKKLLASESKKKGELEVRPSI